CTKDITVSYTKPTAADQATLTIDCNCTEHPNDPEAGLSWDTPTTSDLGTHTFTLIHGTRPLQTGRAVVVKILHNNVEQKQDSRGGLFKACPPQPHNFKDKDKDKDKARSAAVTKGRRTSRATASPSDPITIDPPDQSVIQLVAGHNKRLRGDFDRD